MAAEPYSPPYVRGWGSVAAAATSIAVPWPNHRVGDILTVAINCKRAGAVTITANGTGWVEDPSSPNNVDASTSATADHQTAIFHCRATSSSMPTPTFSNASSDYMLAAYIEVRGCSQHGTVLDAIPQRLAAQNTTGLNTFTWGAVTTTVPDCLIVYFCGTGEGTMDVTGFANAALVDAQERIEAFTLSGDDGAIYIAHGIKEDAGSTGTATATPTIGTRAQSRFTLAYMPPQIDTVAPVVAPTPASGSTIDDDDSLQIDVTDAFGDGLAQLNVLAIYGDGTSENVYSADAFGAKFSNGTNAASSITNGTRLVVKHDAPGLPSASVTYRVTATDKQGNRTVADLAYTVTGYFVPASPAIAAYSPAPGAIGDGDSVTVDVTDSDGDLQRVLVYAERDGATELVHDGLTSGFEDAYAAGSTNTAITNGRRLVVARAGGWGAEDVVLRVRAIDAGARETTSTGTYSTDWEPDPGDVVAPTIELISPDGAQLFRDTPIVVDVEDDVALSISAILVRYPGGDMGVVHSGYRFDPTFRGSTLEILDAGKRHRYTIVRDGGWSTRTPPRLEFLVRDSAGNAAVVNL